MAARSIASLSLSFGLVSIPIKLYSATESSSAIRFKLMAPSGARVRQQYVADSMPEANEEPPLAEPAPEPKRTAGKLRGAASAVLDFPIARREPELLPRGSPRNAESAVIERAQMVKGYEFEKGRFVLFTPDELKALEEGSRQTIDIVSFVPEHSVDPIYYDKAYFLAPDKGGAKPYNLLLRALRDTGRCALAKWAFRAKEYVVEIRPAEGGMVLQQLLYAAEVRSLADLQIDVVNVGDTELKMAKQLIEQNSVASYDATQFVDEERKRILAAVQEKIAGRQIVAPQHFHVAGGEVVDVVEALRASLHPTRGTAALKEKTPMLRLGERKSMKRASGKAVLDSASSKGRASKR